MTLAGTPRKAATVILLRSRRDAGFEVFMTQRPSEMDFLGGYYVFPGGTLREEDASPLSLNRCRGLSATQAQRILGGSLAAGHCLAHWVAATRELFEEVGVLLCVNESGNPHRGVNDMLKARLAEKRRTLLTAGLTFAGLLESEGLFCDVGALSYFSHWLTPEKSRVRFDTRFFLAILPDEQEPLPRSEEVTHSLWVTPEEALKRCRDGNLRLIFPTFATLRSLADFDSLDALGREHRLKQSYATRKRCPHHA
jgi:8-oxo-dGTP pyrophosphatase MutT (NUDIX family)